MDARIGTLVRKGETVFYCYLGTMYREGSVTHLTHLLQMFDHEETQTRPSKLAVAMFKFVAAHRVALGDQFGGRGIVRTENGERVLEIYDRWGHVATDVSVDRGDVFHHPLSDFYVGKF